jgi:hypothetical protein
MLLYPYLTTGSLKEKENEDQDFNFLSVYIYSYVGLRLYLFKPQICDFHELLGKSGVFLMFLWVIHQAITPSSC